MMPEAFVVGYRVGGKEGGNGEGALEGVAGVGEEIAVGGVGAVAVGAVAVGAAAVGAVAVGARVGGRIVGAREVFVHSRAPGSVANGQDPLHV